MRWSWAAVAMLLFLFPVMSAEGGDPVLELDGDIFEISVDPSDPEHGVLEIGGSITADLDMLEQVTVTLSSNITEYRNGSKTGRYWYSSPQFDGVGGGTPVKVLTRTDPNGHFIIKLDPLEVPVDADGIPVPTGIPSSVYGKLVVTVGYTGAYTGETADSAEIIPVEYTLINLSTGTSDVEISAGERLNYTLSIKNAGNIETNAYVDVPLLEELDLDGWETSIGETQFTELVPGEERRTTMLLVAPDEIERTSREMLEIDLRTFEEDPSSGEPVFSTGIRIDMTILRSSVTDPTPDNGKPGNGNNTGDEDGISSGSLVVGMLVIGGVLVFAVILLVLLVKNKDEGEKPPGDTHGPMFRI